MVGPRVVIVGGGITGLATAWEALQAVPGALVTVVDAADRPGGKLRREPVAGVAIDVGAESILARRPEALDLIRELGAADLVVHPETTAAGVWSRGELHPLPSGSLMGIPSPASSALGILTREEVARAEDERPWSAGEFVDVSIGDYVAARLGDAVVDRLVEPLLGGVYAGQARSLSLQACLPEVFEAARAGKSLTETAREVRGELEEREERQRREPVFAGIDGGVGHLPELLTEELRRRGVVFRGGTIVRELHRSSRGWSVIVGARPNSERIAADAVVLAVPAVPTGRLLAHHAPATAKALAGIDYASMAIVTLAVAAEGPQSPDLPGSGFLVPPVEGRTIKASTFSSAKWAWTRSASPDLSFLRASVGRARESSDLHRPDEELVAITVAEVSEALGHQLPRIVDSHVQRWGGALPQYAVGHVDTVAGIRAGLAALPGLEVAGAAYEGVGIPACIASGRAAAQAIATHLRTRPEDERE